MISVIGLGTAASKIAKLFSTTSNYKVYEMSSEFSRTSKYKYRLKSYETPEEYEKNIPNLKKFFAEVDNDVQFFVVGSSYSSNYTLGVLEQLKDKNVDFFYIQPDTELLTGPPKMLDKIVYSILQEYARSGMIRSFTAISHINIEKAIGGVPIRQYYEKVNSAVFSAVHYCNYFQNAEPVIGTPTDSSEINRISTIGMLNPTTLEEKWFFNLDNEREICYYLCINENKLENDGGLHKKIIEKLKNKPRNAFRKISYAIYDTEYEDFGFCVAYTNAIQNYK